MLPQHDVPAQMKLVPKEPTPMPKQNSFQPSQTGGKRQLAPLSKVPPTKTSQQPLIQPKQTAVTAGSNFDDEQPPQEASRPTTAS